MSLSSSLGLLALLNDRDADIVSYALGQLVSVVDVFWAEISDALKVIEQLYETKGFQYRQLAALLAALTHHHLGNVCECTLFALGAGNLLDLDLKSEFVETVTAQCIDKYIMLRSNKVDEKFFQNPAFPDMKENLEKVMERLFRRCIDSRQFHQAIGIAIESKRLDVIQLAAQEAGTLDILKYVMDSSIKYVRDKLFRAQLLKMLFGIYAGHVDKDYYTMCYCAVLIHDPNSVSEILNDLVKQSEKHQLIALQVAFDLEEMANQDFLKVVSDGLEESVIVAKLRAILSGYVPIQVYLEFLHHENNVDLHILKQSKNLVDNRSSLYHSAISFANALMCSGTTNDQFLRENLDWLSRASNWSKFSAAAAIGVISKGHLNQSMKILQPYLPQQGVSSSIYSEGGALYALGMISANYSMNSEFILEQLKKTQNEVIQHGACLGIGATAMATINTAIYDDLKNILQIDNAVASDAAALAMGLVMLGSARESVLNELLKTARETQHERIIRSASLAMAFVMYGQEETADAYIALMLADKDALIRYGGVYMIALAYVGTASNKALKQVLHLAVSDVNDDVRRAAVTAIGFLFFTEPAQVPKIVELLSESYNPHMRYGSCFALGIACASSVNPEALAILERLQSDATDFVRQGSLIAQSLIQVQDSNATPLRTQLAKTISNKHEAPLAKFGAILGQGILDAGGRNCCISLKSRHGTVNMAAVAGMALFLQYWHWFPLTHFLSLSLQPTAFIAIDKDLRIPRLSITSTAKQGMFDYPAPTPLPTQEKVERMHAVLSTSVKAQARARRRESHAAARRMLSANRSPTVFEAMDIVEKPKSEPVQVVERSAEPKPNVSRVLGAQEKYLSFEKCPFQPIKTTRMSGILIVYPVTDTEKMPYFPFNVDFVSEKTAEASMAEDYAIPEAFEFNSDNLPE